MILLLLINVCAPKYIDIKDDSELNLKLKEYEADKNLADDVNFALQHFSYNNSGVLDLVLGHLNNTCFSGITVGIFMC